jgi:hypothetical protein
MKKTPHNLDLIADTVLAYKPKPSATDAPAALLAQADPEYTARIPPVWRSPTDDAVLREGYELPAMQP